MRGLLGGYDEEPQGLFGQLQRGVMSPMFLGGAALLSGEGMGGAFNGMRMGAAFEDDRRRKRQQMRETEAYEGLLGSPDMQANLPKGYADLLRATGPERGFPLLTQFADPNRGFDREVKEAELAKTRAETAKLGRVDPMEGIIAQMLGNAFGPQGAPSAQPPPAAIPQSMPGGSSADPRMQDASFGGMPSIWNGGGDAGDGPSPTPTLETVKNIPSSTGARGPLPPTNSPAYATPRQPSPTPVTGATGVHPWYQQAQYIQAQQPGAQSQPQQAQPQQQPDMVQTPNGLMTREEARRIGNAMLMSPKYSTIGKEFLDAARGADGPPGFAKPTNNVLQERQFNTTEQLARLRGIEQSWKPEYQELETRIGAKWNSLIDKFSSRSLSPAQKEQLANYTASRAEALGNLNLYIKEITGAAMTIPEAERIKKAQPNPGEGIFDGDSPTEFHAKLQKNIRMSKMALARYNYLTKNGFTGDVDAMSREIPLEGMGKVIQQRTDSLLKESLNANPGLTPQDVQPIVQQRLRAEFGI